MTRDKINRRMRTWLREQLPGWRADGIIDSRGETLLSERYGLSEREGIGIAIGALYVLAAFLIGGGVISLVAWHWGDMNRALRLTVLGVGLAAVHTAGFQMWQVSQRQPRLGHAISLLGSLVFGACIGLVAQVFQVSGPWYGAFGAWSLGVLAAGLVLPSPLTTALASFLALYVWSSGYISDHVQQGPAVAWLTGGLFTALAFHFRSRLLFFLATSGLAFALTVAATKAYVVSQYEETPSIPTLLAAVAMLAAYPASARGPTATYFAPLARAMGRIGFWVVTYWLSFRHAAIWVHLPREAGSLWLWCIIPSFLLSIVFLLTRRPSLDPRSLEAALPLLFVTVFSIPYALQAPPLLIAVLANVAALAMATIRVGDGLASLQRLPFWEGLLLGAAFAVSRFFEIETFLWLKGLGFIASGAVVIAIALIFERRLHAREVANA